jgi:hypothetical protein|tara:strand:- start:2167 stop:2397 length:231 start_codon:yes stop_codon:yes gene_type:complete
MAEMMENVEMKILTMQPKWKYYIFKGIVGIDLAEIDKSNHLRMWVYPIKISFITSMKILGITIEILSFAFSVTLSR